jgi:hypothetical protein
LKQWVRVLELFISGVDCNDDARPSECRSLYRIQPDAARADHDDGRARLDLGGVQNGSDARGHGASDERGAFERHGIVDLDEAQPVQRRELGHDRGAHEVIELFAALVPEPRRSVGHLGSVLARPVAERRPPHQAEAARPAHRNPRDRNPIADLEVRDAIADRDDRSCAFVPQHRVGGHGDRTVRRRKVAVAHPAGGYPYGRFLGARIQDFDLFDGDGFAEFAVDDGFRSS